MSKVADEIRRGLEEAIAYAKGMAKERDYSVYVPPSHAQAKRSR
jgi:hypothetical protein